jgi:hypothetical protein
MARATAAASPLLTRSERLLVEVGIYGIKKIFTRRRNGATRIRFLMFVAPLRRRVRTHFKAA